MLTTKQFAELCDTTKRTVVYYDRIGLLKPASRRGTFRYYESKQVLVFQKIKLLQSFGLSLQEAKKYLRKNKNLTDLLRSQKKELEEKKNILEKRLIRLDQFLANLKKGQPLVVPKVKKIMPYCFYGLSKKGRYVDIDSHQRELFNTLKRGKIAVEAGLTIFFEPYYSPHEANMITGAVAKGKPKKIDGIGVYEVPVYRAVVYRHVGPYSYMSYVWQFLDQFVLENKLRRHPGLACREFYLVGPISGAGEEDFVTELQIPIAS